MQQKILVQRYQLPCGDIRIGSFKDQLCLCCWTEEKHPGRVLKRLQTYLHADFKSATSDVIRKTIIQLDEYFHGNRRYFDIPLLFVGTDFQQHVWQQLLDIPYGKVLSYKELSEQLGNPKGVRAVANANGANAIAIIVPCHRVIGSDHSLTGYAGGIETKRFLLELEQGNCEKSNEGIMV